MTGASILGQMEPWIAKNQPGPGGERPAQDPARGTGAAEHEDDDDLLCSTCGHPITREIHRIAVDDHHEHTFVNPGGFAYRIGCFEMAPGCVELGDPERYFTWFAGYTWQIVACASCRVQLGWIYRRLHTDSFHGLILDRLRPRTPGDRPVAPS